MKKQKAKRATFYMDREGEFRYRVQSGNWHVIEATEEGFRSFSYCVRRLAERWPKVKEVVLVNAVRDEDVGRIIPEDVTSLVPGSGTMEILVTGKSLKVFFEHYAHSIGE